jgi:hypothetical protein
VLLISRLKTSLISLSCYDDTLYMWLNQHLCQKLKLIKRSKFKDLKKGKVHKKYGECGSLSNVEYRWNYSGLTLVFSFMPGCP